MYLNNVGISLGDRYSRTGATADLEEAIQVARKAVDATPDNHPDQAGRFNNLGIRLSDRYSRTRAIVDLQEATSCYNSALHQVTSNIATRIRAGRGVLINAAKTFNWKQAYEASTLAVSLVPKVIPRSLENSDKQHTLSRVAGLASDAAAAALNFQQPPVVALRLLEQGRGLLAASTDEMRVDIFDLQEADPNLAEKFIAVREKLQPLTMSETDAEQTDRSFCQSHSDQRHKADEQFDKLITEIRDKDGFENFLDAPSFVEMQAAAASGPIAVINVSAYRCDAILVETHQVRVLKLPSLKQDEIKKKTIKDDLGSPEVLQWLWDVVSGGPELVHDNLDNTLKTQLTVWLAWCSTSLLPEPSPSQKTGQQVCGPPRCHNLNQTICRMRGDLLRLLVCSAL
jgi:hypothetical protein